MEEDDEEWKIIDTGTIPVSPSTGGTVQLLNGVGTGTDYTHRSGRLIYQKTLELKVFFFPDETVSSPNADILRTMVIYDYQTNGALPLVTDILQGANYAAQYNLNNRERFLVLHDEFQTTRAATYTGGLITGGDISSLMQEIELDLNSTVVFGGTTNLVGSIFSGGIFLLLISANGSYTASINSRIRFSDT